MVRVAVIGTGYLGRLHARVYSELEEAQLAAVVDVDRARADDIAAAHGSRAYTDFREVLPFVDAVSVVTPTETHYGIAMECLRAGKDILVEKPIASTVREADSLIDEAARRGLCLQVGHIERFNPATDELLPLFESPRFVEAERVSPFLGRAMDVDVTLDLMIHDIDIALSLFGCPKVSGVRAVGASVITDRLDYVKAWVDFEGGRTAFFTAARVSAEKRRIMRVFEAGRFVEIDFMNRKLIVKGRNGELDIEAGDREPLKEELRDFIRCVSEKRSPKVKPLEARDALDLALKISEEARKRG
jgi:predicted dehydrogenase